MKKREAIWDDYLNRITCRFCFEEIKFNAKYVAVKWAKKQGYKRYHPACFTRVRAVYNRRSKRIDNPVGRYGAKSGG